MLCSIHLTSILHGMMVSTSAFRLRKPSSNPGRVYFINFFEVPLFSRAKITPFQRKDFGKNLPKWSTNSTCSFKPKKFTVGHFDLGRHVCLRNLDSVNRPGDVLSRFSPVPCSCDRPAYFTPLGGLWGALDLVFFNVSLWEHLIYKD